MDKNKIIEDIKSYREQKMPCAPSTLLGICKNINCDLTEEQLHALGAGFASGIGGNLEAGTCGGITGATIALGLVNENPEKVKELSKSLFDNFKEEFESVECNKLSDNGDDKTHCTDYCIFGGEEFFNLMNE